MALKLRANGVRIGLNGVQMGRNGGGIACIADGNLEPSIRMRLAPDVRINAAVDPLKRRVPPLLLLRWRCPTWVTLVSLFVQTRLSQSVNRRRTARIRLTHRVGSSAYPRTGATPVTPRGCWPRRASFFRLFRLEPNLFPK